MLTMIHSLDEIWLKLQRWFVRHVHARIHAPSLLDDRWETIRLLKVESARWQDIAAKRLGDNKKLMVEVCGRIEAFRGATRQLKDVNIQIVPRRQLKIAILEQIPVMQVNHRASEPVMISHDSRTMDIQEYHANANLGLYCPEDFSNNQLRWATAIILIDQIAVFIAQENIQRQQEFRTWSEFRSALP